MSAVDRRVGLLFAGFVLLFCVAVARAAWLQGVEGGAYKANAQSQQSDEILVPGLRGTIADRNGVELAQSVETATIVATPYEIKDPVATANKVARILGGGRKQIAEAISDRDSGFAYVARDIDPALADQIDALGIHGLYDVPDSVRIHPQGELAAQVVGVVSEDPDKLTETGLTGLEQGSQDVLAGTDGKIQIYRDGEGREIDRDTVSEASPGSNLKLTIDNTIQASAEQALAEIGEQYKPERATAIVMDPRNSQVLAMANWPRVDPDNPESNEALMNMATGYTYEPGSTFKGFTVAGALEQGLVRPETTFDLPPEIQVADRTIGEAHARGYATLSVADILAQSSNVGAVTIGLELGPMDFDHWVRKFGFGKPTGIDFPADEQGIVIEPGEYSGSSIGNLPIGQGLSVTPIQMATAYSAIANGGILRPPRLVLEEGGKRVPDPAGVRVISERTSSELRTMLEGVLGPFGTAPEVSVPGYVLAGKTGTAEKVVDGEYSDTQYIASFVGFAPADDPRLLAAIVVDSPRGDYYGGTVAAPAFGEIASAALPYLGVPTSG